MQRRSMKSAKLFQEFLVINAASATILGGLGALGGAIFGSENYIANEELSKRIYKNKFERATTHATKLIQEVSKQAAAGALVGATVGTVTLWGPPLWTYNAIKEVTTSKTNSIGTQASATRPNNP